MYTHQVSDCFSNRQTRVAVKLRRADLSVVTTDELGAGDTFGEECMLDEKRHCKTNNPHLNSNAPVLPPSTAVDGGGGQGGLNSDVTAAVGRSFETYQMLEVRGSAWEQAIGLSE